eukprot:11338843-Alexandrium_andersonii.AAC.1
MTTRPKPSAAPLTMPARPAFPELKATVLRAVDQCLMARNPRTHTPPQMDRRVRMHPAKSASTRTRRGASSSCRGKWQTHRGRTI